MKKHRIVRSIKHLALLTMFAGLALTQLSGCNGIPIPAIPITVNLAGNTIMTTDIDVNGEITVTVGAFCDLFDADSLDATLRQAAGDLIADLVQITGAELQSVQINASTGDFSTLTSADLTLDGATSIPLGSATDSGGLGTSFTMMQDTPVDLINDLDGQCGVANVRLMGSTPAEDITFTAVATINVQTQLTL